MVSADVSHLFGHQGYGHEHIHAHSFNYPQEAPYPPHQAAHEAPYPPAAPKVSIYS